MRPTLSVLLQLNEGILYSISQLHAVNYFEINLFFPVVFAAANGTVFLYGHVVAVAFAANGWQALYGKWLVYLV